MNVLGNEFSREAILRRNNPAALYGARRVELVDGKGRGHKLIQVKTTSGLRALFSESRCLDIVELEYRGINFGFLSKNDIVETPIANPEVDSFTKYWAGGFLSTCGLRNTGGDCKVDGEFFPTHGHIGLTPGNNVHVKVNEEEIVISGRMRESSLFGHCLELERNIHIPSDGTKVTVRDIVHNLTPEEEPVFILYHINFGFPFLSEHMQMQFPEATVRGRSYFAQQHISQHAVITPPIDGAAEQVFFHTIRDAFACIELTNTRLGVKGSVQYNTIQLPILTQWKCMRSGDYALGIEPGTSYIRGRKEELESGYDIKVPGFGTLEFGFAFEIEDLK